MKLSIIIPIINPENHILYRLYSSINFCVKNCEKEIILVSDTQFKPESLEYYKEFKNDNWKFVINKKPIGIFESRRKGLKKATGDLIWFLDSTDSVCGFNFTENMLDYDVALFDLAYFKENGVSISNYYIHTYGNYGFESDDDYKKLNPFANRHMIKKYLNPFIDNFIFKTDYIKSIYEKIPTINNFNKFSNLYLITAALKYMKSFKYYNKAICSICMKPNYCNDEFTVDGNKPLIFGRIFADEFINDKQLEEFKSILEKDEANISKEIITFLDSLKSNDEDIKKE